MCVDVTSGVDADPRRKQTRIDPVVVGMMTCSSYVDAALTRV